MFIQRTLKKCNPKSVLLTVMSVKVVLGLCSMEIKSAVTGREGRVVEGDDKLILWR